MILFKKSLKYLAYFFAFIIVLAIVVILSLRIPAVQNFAKGKFIHYLENKIQTKVSLESVYISFPNSIVLHNLYLEDQKKDTLLYAKNADIGLNLPKLLKNTADLTSIDLETVRANVIRNKKGKFNFDYILNAFATKDAEASPSKPFIISLDKIKLRDIGVNFTDLQAHNDIQFYVKSFDTRVKTFDLQKNSYAVNKIKMDGLQLNLKQDLVEEVATKVVKTADSLNQKAPLKVALNELDLTNFNITYGDDNSKTYAKILFQKLGAKINFLDIQNNAYNIDNLELIGANIDAKSFLATSKTTEKNQIPESEITKNKPLKLVLNKLILDRTSVVYNNTAIKPTPVGLDYNHLDFSKLNLELRNFKMTDSNYSGTINSAEIKEHRGLDIQKLHTDFAYNDRQAFLKDLYLQTPYTLLRDQITLNYNSLEQLSKNIGAVKFNANIQNSKLGFKDILIFAPNLRQMAPFNKYPNAILQVNTRIDGTLDYFLIHTLQLSGLDKLKIIASGTIRNATNPSKLFYDLKIGELASSAKTVFNLVPKETIPQNIALPSYFKISGTAVGTIKNINTNLNITSSLGAAKIKALVDMRLKNREKYDVLANLQNLKIGQIIKNKEVGPFTGQVKIKGESFDPKLANAVLSGHVNSAVYKNYRYQNMSLEGKINRGAYQINLNSKDPNANLHLMASGYLNDKNPALKASGNIIKLDLHKLGFYKDPLILAGKIDADFTNLNPDALNGYLHLDQFALSDTKNVYPLQQVNLTAISSADKNEITLKSQVADFYLTGKYKLTEIFASLQETLNSYYQFENNSKNSVRLNPNQYFTFTGKIKDDKLIKNFLPDLKNFDVITLNGNYDADSRKINLTADAPTVVYGENTIKNVQLTVDNKADALDYHLSLGTFKTPKLALQKIDLAGNVANNVISYKATSKDDDDKTKFLVAGQFKNVGDISVLSLDRQGLVLNYDPWNVAADNALSFGKNGLNAQNFTLSNSESKISLQSDNRNLGSPLNISLQNFKIETFTELLKKDSLLAKGSITGVSKIKNLNKNPSFDANFNVNDLFVYGSPVGNLNLKATSLSSQMLQTDITLSGNENVAKLFGTYNMASSELAMKFDLDRLQMKTVQGFSLNAIENTEGYLSGNLDISGKISSPQILGKLKFNNVGLEIAKLGSHFKDINDEIRFTPDGIKFDDFKIKDDSGNPFTIDGAVFTKTYTDYQFNLNLNAENFKIVDSEKKDDKMLYGILGVDADLEVRGDLKLPRVSGKISVTDQTDFTFVLPQSSPQLQAREGIVEFIDQDQVALTNTIKKDTITNQTAITGLDVNVNIEVTKKAKTSIVIDKANGDFIKLQGEAELTGGIDPSGKTTLVGVYTVEKGAYELSVSLLKRKFEIEKGSTITWTGEPTSAQLDITANYKTKAAPYDLVAQQLGGSASNSELNQYKQQIPFNTLLILKGELLKPQITFDITTDENNNAVSSDVLDNTKAKLDQLRRNEAELNKQVFALLLLNRFIGENPFESNGGLSASTIAKQSVSKILSQQLNNLAADLIGGVELNFDLESTEDYSSGTKDERTDLNIGLSKTFLDDRLKVTVGNSFGVLGDARKNEKTTNIAGDLTVDYALSKDGRYMLRAYRKNEYQVALQGQIIETGVGFIITLDYNKFREIFQKAEKDKNRRQKSIKN